MITRYSYTSYNRTQWFLKFIKSGLDKFYINIYHILRIRDLAQNI